MRWRPSRRRRARSASAVADRRGGEPGTRWRGRAWIGTGYRSFTHSLETEQYVSGTVPGVGTRRAHRNQEGEKGPELDATGGWPRAIGCC